MIISNQIRCKKCNDTPFSTHTRDFKFCKCGTVAVDGGMDYLRRVGDPEDIEEMSISMEESTIERCLNTLEMELLQGKNLRGALYGIFRTLRDEGIELNPIEKDP